MKASQEGEDGEDDEASKKNVTTWWRRGFRTQDISKPELLCDGTFSHEY